MNTDIEVIATLQVVMRRGDTNGVSSAMGMSDPGHYLVLRPDVDKQNFSNPKLLQTVLAHELGHFVAYLTEHRSLLADERDAWRIAEKIAPVSKIVEADALRGYAENADREMADPMRRASIFADEAAG